MIIITITIITVLSLLLLLIILGLAVEIDQYYQISHSVGELGRATRIILPLLLLLLQLLLLLLLLLLPPPQPPLLRYKRVVDNADIMFRAYADHTLESLPNPGSSHGEAARRRTISESEDVQAGVARSRDLWAQASAWMGGVLEQARTCRSR